MRSKFAMIVSPGLSKPLNIVGSSEGSDNNCKRPNSILASSFYRFWNCLICCCYLYPYCAPDMIR